MEQPMAESHMWPLSPNLSNGLECNCWKHIPHYFPLFWGEKETKTGVQAHKSAYQISKAKQIFQFCLLLKCDLASSIR